MCLLLVAFSGVAFSVLLAGSADVSSALLSCQYHLHERVGYCCSADVSSFGTGILPASARYTLPPSSPGIADVPSASFFQFVFVLERVLTRYTEIVAITMPSDRANRSSE